MAGSYIAPVPLLVPLPCFVIVLLHIGYSSFTYSAI